MPPFGSAAVIELRELGGIEQIAAAQLSARAMRDDPVHIAVFGTNPKHRLRQLTRFFATLLRVLRAPPLSLWEGNRLLGVAGRAPPGTCWPPMATRLRMAARLLSPNLPELWRLARWLHACEQRDLSEPHWHLGPIAVEIGRQGQGLGTRMMQALGTDLDREGQTAFLETDKPENVRFYGKFGFEVVNEADVLGTRNWWMRRPGEPAAKPLAI